MYSDKSGCIRAKAVVDGQKWLYSGKSGCNREKVVVFEQSGFIGAKVCFGQNSGGCIWTKVVVFGKDSEKLVVFGKSGCIRAKWLYLGKVVVIGETWF